MTISTSYKAISYHTGYSLVFTQNRKENIMTNEQIIEELIKARQIIEKIDGYQEAIDNIYASILRLIMHIDHIDHNKG